PACSELRWAYCNHKATYFASYLTGGDCVPDDQRSEERFSRNAETDLVCRLLLEKKKNRIRARSACEQSTLGAADMQCRKSHTTLLDSLSTSAILCLFCYAFLPPTLFSFFFNDPATTEIYTLSLHDALPICPACSELRWAYCNHKATYFASYLTGGDCVPDDQ